MGCKQLNIKIENCKIKVLNTCKGGGVEFFKEIVSINGDKITLGTSGGKCKIFEKSCITLPYFETTTELCDWINTELAACGDTTDSGSGEVDPPVIMGKVPLGGILIGYHTDDKKCETPIKLYQFNDNGVYCVTNDPEGNNIVNLNNYVMNETKLGQLIASSPLIPTEIPYEADGISICLDGSEVDVVATVEASTIFTDFVAAMTEKYPLPEGATYELSKLSMNQYSGNPKQTVHCDILGEDKVIGKNTQVKVVAFGNTSHLTVGDMKPYYKNTKGVEVVTDEGCFVCNDIACTPQDGEVMIPANPKNDGNAIQVDFCIICSIVDPAAAEGEG